MYIYYSLTIKNLFFPKTVIRDAANPMSGDEFSPRYGLAGQFAKRDCRGAAYFASVKSFRPSTCHLGVAHVTLFMMDPREELGMRI